MSKSMNFPRQVDNTEILDVLQKFYKDVDRSLVETYKQFHQINENGPSQVSRGSLDEVEFNQKEFRRALNEIRSGEETVTVRWYSASISGGANPRLKNDIKEIQLNQRYGKWFKDENVVT